MSCPSCGSQYPTHHPPGHHRHHHPNGVLYVNTCNTCGYPQNIPAPFDPCRTNYNTNGPSRATPACEVVWGTDAITDMNIDYNSPLPSIILNLVEKIRMLEGRINTLEGKVP